MHPYWQEDQAEYAKRVRAYDIKPPALLGVMPPPADNAEVSAILHRCLSPDPAARPTAPEIRAALSGRAPKTVTLPASTGTADRHSGATGSWRRRRNASRPQPRGRRGRGGEVDVEQDSAGDGRWPVAAGRHSHRDRQGRSSAASARTPSSGTTGSASSSAGRTVSGSSRRRPAR